MVNITLFKRGIERSWKTFVIFALVLTMYITIIVLMFNPEMNKVLMEFEQAMPELMAMVGMDGGANNLIGFMSSYLYGFVMVIFPMVFSVIIINSLMARLVEQGSMTYLLAAPVKRKTVAKTQMSVVVISLFLLITYSTLIGLITSKIAFPGELNVSKFILLNISLLALHLFIGGITFLSSCIFNEAKLSLAFGAGIPALSYIIQMIANLGEKTEKAKYLTFFTLFNPSGIIQGEGVALVNIAVLFVAAALLFALSLSIFNKKDLYI